MNFLHGEPRKIYTINGPLPVDKNQLIQSSPAN